MVAVDYFSKWIEVEPLAIVTARNIQNFFWKNIVCHFGLPRVLISNNGKQFEDIKFQEWCQNMGIRQNFTSVAHPQENGQTKLWARRTTEKTATGETPFNLTYGTEAVIPTEIEVPTLRLETYDDRTNGDELRTNLDLLDEVRDLVHIRTAAYQ